MAKQASQPLEAEMVARARALIPVLRERAARQDAHRRILDETMADLKDAGLFRVLQPKRWGGYEMSPGTFFDIEMALAEGDTSVGWVYGILGVHSFHLALFDDRAAQDVWGQDSSVLVASPYVPGRAVPVAGGYRFTGRWKFSSGTEHCDWCFLGGAVEGNEAGGFLESRTFLLPRQDYEIVDTWHATGLKGTGSQDVVVNDVFVPEYRTLRNGHTLDGKAPGLSVNDGVLFRYPFWQVFLRAVSSSAIGALQATCDAFAEFGRQRVSYSAGSMARDPEAQMALAEALAGIAEMKLVLHHNFAAMQPFAERGELPPLEDRLLYKYQTVSVPRRCGDLALALFRTAGGTGIFTSQPFGRLLNDILAQGNHGANSVKGSAKNWGAVTMGLENADLVL